VSRRPRWAARRWLGSIVLAASVGCISMGGSVSSAVGAPEEAEVYRTVLPNGMRAIVRERPGSDVVAISVATRGGSRDERTETVGAAHFMEHMYFQGTPRRPDAADIDREIEARGGWTNAWTGWESINFQVVAPTEDVDLALDIISDQMVNSLFAREKIDKERRVVLEELNGRLNSPSSKAFDLFLLEVFGEHPAHNLPIGNRSTIDRSTREVVVSFRDTYFVAGNMAVAVVGDVKHEETFEKLAKAFAEMRTGPVPPMNSAPVPPLVPRLQVDSSPAQQARIIVGGPTVGYDSPDRYVLDVIEAILGESGRRLERELVDTQAIASSVYPFYYALTDVAVWGISAGARPADVDRVVDLSKAQLTLLREQAVAPEELDEAKAYLRGQRLLHRERSVDLAEELSDGEVLRTYEPMEAYLGRIDAVSAADIQRVARAFVDPDRLTQTVLRP
jgi:predicted Zn-dependent peptidase